MRSTFAERGFFGTAPREAIADRGLPTGGSAVEDRRGSIAKVPPAPKTVPNAAPETGQAR